MSPTPASLHISLVYASAPRTVHEAQLSVPAGATLGQALELAGWPQRFPAITAQPLSLGIWGRPASLQTVLASGDRVEIYRHLRVDPKAARRERFASQGARSAGLFARKRQGAKAGY